MDQTAAGQTAAGRVPPAIREQIERYLGDRERCMPSERARLERDGFTAIGEKNVER
jgi:hypothetical protein